MHACRCTVRHTPSLVVLTGGPGAGKTAIIEFIRMAFCRHVKVLPEAAGVVFHGGFPRDSSPVKLRAVQRAIYHVQRELERSMEEENAAVILCDRGTVDGLAYWPGPEDFWKEVDSSLSDELDRYSAVIHLRTPREENGYNYSNPLRIEGPEEARAIDERIGELWADHPNWHEVPPTDDFLVKARSAMEILRDQVPECCQHAISPLMTP